MQIITPVNARILRLQGVIKTMKSLKLRVFFEQFSLTDALRFLWSKTNQRLFDPHNFSSYAQTGEDRIISHLLASETVGESGFYVDVGCNHPQVFSNTFSLYQRGWRGITVDANEELVRSHQKLRQRDTSICAVVSNNTQEVVFTEFEDSLVSSLSKNHIDEWKEKRKIKKQRTVKPIALTTLLKENSAPKSFDLLSIDVEGHDFEVLSSLDLDFYRPRLIMIEMHGFDITNPTASNIYTYLSAHRYKMIGYAVMNGYFVSMTEPLPHSRRDSFA